MSETTTVILKVISAIASPKAALKFICIALALGVSWHTSNSFSWSNGIPKDQIGILILFLGIGSGTILGELAHYILNAAYGLTLKSLIDKRKRILDESERRASEEKILNHFQITYKNYNQPTKDALWKLSKGPQPLGDEYETNININSLLSNKYIHKFSVIDNHYTLYEINSALQEFIEKEMDSVIKENTSKFVSELSPIKDELIRFLSEKDYKLETALTEIEEYCEGNEVLFFYFNYKCDSYENPIKDSFFIGFDDFYIEKLEIELGKKFYPRKEKITERSL